MQVLLPEQSLANNLADAVGQRLKIVDGLQNLIKVADIADVMVEHKEKVQDSQTNEKINHDDTNCKKEHTTVGNAVTIESCRAAPITTTTTPFPGISQLLPSLYLCGAGVAIPHILDQLQVRFIINVAPELPDTPLSSRTKPLYLRINVHDRPDVDLMAHFDEVADMIEEVRQHGGKSLVHCVAGVSRSATLCIAYLMKHGGMRLRDAYLHVKAIRPQIRPNTGFFQQLRRYEEMLHGTCSVKMVFYASLNKEIPDVYEPEYRAMEEFYQRQRKALRQRR